MTNNPENWERGTEQEETGMMNDRNTSNVFRQLAT